MYEIITMNDVILDNFIIFLYWGITSLLHEVVILAKAVAAHPADCYMALIFSGVSSTKTLYCTNTLEQTYTLLNKSSPFWYIFKINYGNVVLYKPHYIMNDFNLHYRIMENARIDHSVKYEFKNYVFRSAFGFKNRLHLHFYTFDFYYQSRITPNFWWKLYNVTLEWSRLFAFELNYDNKLCTNKQCWDVTHDVIIDGILHTNNQRFWASSASWWFPELNSHKKHLDLVSYIQNKHEKPLWVAENMPSSIYINWLGTLPKDLPLIGKEILNKALIG